MFDIGASELLVIVIVAILVIGPKQMPDAMRTAGRWIGKARRISGHFRTGIDAMVREAELEDMEREWKEQNAKIMAEFPDANMSGREASGVGADGRLPGDALADEDKAGTADKSTGSGAGSAVKSADNRLDGQDSADGVPPSAEADNSQAPLEHDPNRDDPPLEHAEPSALPENAPKAAADDDPQTLDLFADMDIASATTPDAPAANAAPVSSAPSDAAKTPAPATTKRAG